MPTTAQTFYPSATDDDQDFPGVTENVKKLVESAPGANTSTTVTWTDTTVRTKTVIPLTDSTAASDTSSNNGWAINDGGADGMGSVSGGLRRVRAGVWSFSVQMTLNTPALLDTHALTITAHVYRVADINAGAGGARTLLFSATSGNQTASATVTWNSASEPEILLQPGETIMVGFTASSASTTALVLGANTNTVMTVALGGNTSITVPAPGIETIANTNGTSAGTATVNGAASGTGAMAGSSAGSAAASGALAATGATVGTSDGTSAASGAMAAVAPMVGSSAGLATVSGALSAVGATVGSSEGVATASAAGATVIPTVGASAGVATVSGTMAATGAMVGTVDGAGSASGSMGAVAETTGSAAGLATASGALAAVAPTVGTVNVGQGGGATEYPDGLLRLRPDGRIESVASGSGELPPGALRLVALP